MMRPLALAHDWFETLGGSERVALELASLYPQAPIYTLLFDSSKYPAIDKGRVHTSWLQGLPKWARTHRKFLLPLIPSAVNHLNLKGYRVVLSSSNGFIKGINTPNDTYHICYCHTPPRFAWEDAASYLNQHAGGYKQWLARWLLGRFRRWDKQSVQGVDLWLANSRYTAQRLSRYYDVGATVIYPPVETQKFRQALGEPRGDFYLTLSTLARYKGIDLVIRAFNKNGNKLIVIGDGPERARLEQLARTNIKFTGWVDEATKINYLARARGLIFPAVEDFGIAPVEAMAAGTPVLALGRGGLLETVQDGISGTFFSRPTPDSINGALARFAKIKFDPSAVSQSVAKFDRRHFISKINSIVEKATNGR